LKPPTPPKEITLFSKTTNPIRDEAVIEFQIPVIETDGSTPFLMGGSATSEVSLIIYNLAGQKVKTLVGNEMGAGTHRVFWNRMDDSGSLVPSGIYFARLALGNASQTRKLILLH
jgi:flagellar hook assembly protein FlgD